MLTPVKRILFATSLEPATRPVSRMAASLAVQYKAQILLVHALKPKNDGVAAAKDSQQSSDNERNTKSAGYREVQRSITEKVQAFFDEEMVEHKHLKLFEKTIVEEAKPGDLILRVAAVENIDLIVMGSQQPKGVKKLFAGSVANYVMERSSKPVLIVPLA